MSLYYLGGIPLRQAEPLAYGDKAPTVTHKPHLENVWTLIARAEREARAERLGLPKIVIKKKPRSRHYDPSDPRKTHCKNGHERTSENVQSNLGCRLCVIEARARRSAVRRAKKGASKKCGHVGYHNRIGKCAACRKEYQRQYHLNKAQRKTA